MLRKSCWNSTVRSADWKTVDHSVLDVGCGWGSLTLYIAEKYSNCKITGICNSTTQKEYIMEQCRTHRLANVEIIVADISIYEMEASYDRIFSIEMFENMKNYKDLLKKISKWMKDDGLLFIHHFCHFAYHYEDVNEDDWITRYFFSGGTMPAANFLLYFQDGVSVVDHWLINRKHYAHTSEEWLKRMDRNMGWVRPIIEETYGKDSAVKWTVYWRTFSIAVAELLGITMGKSGLLPIFCSRRSESPPWAFPLGFVCFFHGSVILSKGTIKRPLLRGKEAPVVH